MVYKTFVFEKYGCYLYQQEEVKKFEEDSKGYLEKAELQENLIRFWREKKQCFERDCGAEGMGLKKLQTFLCKPYKAFQED